MTIEEVKTYVKKNFATGVMNFYAMMFNQYTVTFLNQNDTAVV
jgi:hypothetical protein